MRVNAQKWAPWLDVESNGYDWFGLPRTARSGFDSRYILSIRRTRLPVCRPGGIPQWLLEALSSDADGGY